MNLKKLYTAFLIIIFLFGKIYLFAQISPLADGKIYKFSVSREGVYKITAAYLESLNIQTSHVHPDAIKLYGLPGGMLPQKNNAFQYEQLQEIATYKKNSSNRFDYLLFFAEGADTYHYDGTDQLFRHQKNLYADKNFYFLKISQDISSQGLIIQDAPSLSNATNIFDTYYDYIHYEKDLYNLLLGGRQWFGDRYNFPTQANFNFNIEGIVKNSPLYLATSVVSSSSNSSAGSPTSSSSFHFSIEGKSLPEIQMASLPSGVFSVKAYQSTKIFKIDPIPLIGKNNMMLFLDYQQESSTNPPSGYIDYLTLSFERMIRFYGDQTIFRKMKGDNTANEYHIANGEKITMIWNITDPLIPVNYSFNLSGKVAIFRSEENGKYVAFNEENLTFPFFEESISNQNLYQLATPNLLIISPIIFLEEAERLAQFRRTHDGLKVAVTSLDAIYNEFSSGRQDISAIRNFIRSLYHRDNRLKYILLFGDASYDYKERIPNNTNFVPTYQAKNSLDPVNSYSSDDFYGFLDKEEGEWRECSTCRDHDLDVGIGRLPISNKQEANEVVDKFIRYSANVNTFGNWRSRLVFVGDDEDNNIHQHDANTLASFVEKNYRNYNIDRLFIDAYPQQTHPQSPTSQQSPIVREALNRHIERGTLIINYSGHGSENGLAEENILNSAQIEDLNNYNNMPLLVTATCEFGRYDNPSRISGAEIAIINGRGGAIGLLTTVRPVLRYSNFIINQKFYEYVFKPIDNKMPRLGDIIKATKNSTLTSITNSISDRNFTLLGDPSLRLAYPQDSIKITNILADNNHTDTIRALNKVKIEAEVINYIGTTNENFNGLVETVIYAKKITFTTLGDRGNPKEDFQNRSHILYRGKSFVKEGKFNFSFVVPKDINYQFGTGKISLYAYDTANRRDAIGSKENIYVGGSTLVPEDNTPPQITAYLENPYFKDGMQVPADPVLYASIFDERGINISGIGIGHDIVAILDKDESNSFILNDFFTTKIDDYQNGKLIFQFPDLPQGTHHLLMRAWDTHNNFSEVELSFFIGEQYFLELSQVINYPNPFTKQTTFSFVHNRENEELDITIQIYSTKGQSVLMLNSRVRETSGRVDNIIWDRTNDKVRNGIYLYDLIVKSLKDGASNKKIGKFLIID